jgi:hypothetical protein
VIEIAREAVAGARRQRTHKGGTSGSIRERSDCSSAARAILGGLVRERHRGTPSARPVETMRAAMPDRIFPEPAPARINNAVALQHRVGFQDSPGKSISSTP